MKYKSGNILLLNDGRTVYVAVVDEESEVYHVFDMEDEDEQFKVCDEDVFQLVVSA